MRAEHCCIPALREVNEARTERKGTVHVRRSMVQAHSEPAGDIAQRQLTNSKGNSRLKQGSRIMSAQIGNGNRTKKAGDAVREFDGWHRSGNGNFEPD